MENEKIENAKNSEIENENNEKSNKELKKDFVRAIKFLLFSISAGLIQMGLYALFGQVFHFPDWLAYLIGLCASVIWNFTFNRKFTFKSANNIPIAMLKVAGYYAVFTPLSTLFVAYLTETVLWNGFLVTFLNMLINLVTEFLFQRFFVFGKSIDTIVKKQ